MKDYSLHSGGGGGDGGWLAETAGAEGGKQRKARGCGRGGGRR